MSNLNMPVKYCTDENGNPYSPVVYQESMFNDDASRMDPVPRKMFAKAYDPTKTYPTENLFCIQDNKYYKFTGSGTTTGTFDPTKWTETDDATELTALNSTLANRTIATVTADGVKTYRKIMSELYASISSLPEAKIRMSMLCVGVNNMPCTAYSSGTFIVYSKSTVASNSVSNSAYNLRSAENSNEFYSATQTGSTLTIEDKSTQVPSSGTVFSVIGIV